MSTNPRFSTRRFIFVLAFSASVVAPFVIAPVASADDFPESGPACVIDATILKSMKVQLAQDMYNHPEKYAYIPWCDVAKGVTLAADIDTNHNGIIDSLEPAPSATPTPVPVAAASKPTVATTPKITPSSTPAPAVEAAAITQPSPSVSPSASPSPDVKVAAQHTSRGPLPLIFALAAVLLAAAGFTTWFWRRSQAKR